MKEYKTTITLQSTREELESMYRKHHGTKGRVTKKDLANWFNSLLSSDLEDCPTEDGFG